MSESLLARVKGIPQLVNRQVMLFKATGGHKYMRYFKATEAEVTRAADKAMARMCALELRLAVAEDLLRNATYINRTIETYQERVAELLAELAGPAFEPAGPDGPVAESADGYKGEGESDGQVWP